MPIVYDEKPATTGKIKYDDNPSFLQNVGEEFKTFPKRTIQDIMGVGQGISDLVSGAVKNPSQILPMAGQAADSIVNFPIEKATEAIYNPKGLYQEAGNFAHEHPAQSIAALLPVAKVAGSAAGAAEDIVGSKIGSIGKLANVEPKTLPASQLIRGSLEGTVAKNLMTNPFVRDGMTVYAKEELPTKVMPATVQSIGDTKNAIDAAEHYLYTKNGITNELTPTHEAAYQNFYTKANSALKNMNDKIESFKGSAVTPEQEQAVTTAQKAIGLISDKITDPEKGLNFGQLKQLTKTFWDNAENNVTPDGALTSVGTLYKDLYKEMRGVKNSLPQVEGVSKDFADLEKTKEKINQFLRLNDSGTSEQRLPSKILRGEKDLQGSVFQKRLDEVNDALKKHTDLFNENPDTQGIINKYGNSSMVDNIKLSQALHNATSAKAAPTSGVNIPFISSALKGITKPFTSPLTRAMTIKRLVNMGIINPEMASAPVTESQIPFIGRGITNIRALGAMTKR